MKKTSLPSGPVCQPMTESVSAVRLRAGVPVRERRDREHEPRDPGEALAPVARPSAARRRPRRERLRLRRRAAASARATAQCAVSAEPEDVLDHVPAADHERDRDRDEHDHRDVEAEARQPALLAAPDPGVPPGAGVAVAQLEGRRVERRRLVGRGRLRGRPRPDGCVRGGPRADSKERTCKSDTSARVRQDALMAIARPMAAAAGRARARSKASSSPPERAPSRPRSARRGCSRPYFGSSTIVWANIIGLVLAALSVGYWLGGRARRPAAADGRCWARSSSRRASRSPVVPFAARPFLDVTVRGLDQISVGRGRRLLRRVAAPVRAARRPARDGDAVRRAARGHGRDAAPGALAGRLYALSTARQPRRRLPVGARR